MIRSAWFGDPDPDDAEIGRWLLHCFPIADRRAWEALRDGLAIAGLVPQGSAIAPFHQSSRLLAAADRVIRDA